MKLPANFRPTSPSPLAALGPLVAEPVELPSPPAPLQRPEMNETTLPEDDEDYESPSIPFGLLHKLLTFPLFQDAPKAFHAKVAAKLKLVQYTPQEYIIKEGDPALSMYWILKGQVSVTSTDGESVYAELAQGAFFGEIGILFNRPRTATVVARLRVLLGVLTADSLNIVLRSYPLIERRIRDEAQERLAMQEKKNRAEIPILKPSNLPAPNAWPMHLVAPPMAHLNPLPLSQLVHASELSTALSTATLADNVDQTVSLQQFIKSVPILSNLPPHILHKLALGVEPMNYKPFEYIFRKNSLGSDIYFVIHGEVEVVDYVNNAEQVLARLKLGAYFGEMSFLESLHKDTAVERSASIRTVSSVELVVIRTDQLQAICAQYPFIVEEMRRTANERKNLNNAATLHPPPFTFSGAPREASSTLLLPISAPDSNLSLGNSISSTNGRVLAPQPTLFNPNWDFGAQPGGPAAIRAGASRSVSPVSSFDSEPRTSKTPLSKAMDENHRKRNAMSDSVSPLQQLPTGPLDMMVPPMNPVVPLLNTFQNFAPGSRRQSFQYMPHNKRIKLANLAGRRRSSVLVSVGSIPDKILLKVFEYLTLPELMRLRIISHRWRQLLYVAPNLFERLDLTPWNTSVTDDALISITDFVGARPKYIDISNCFHLTDEGFSYMVNEIGMSGKIKVLKMKSIWEVSAMAIMDLTSPSVGRYLEEVDLSNCRKVKDNVVERLIGWVNESTRKSFQLEGILINEVGSKNLKILNLGYCKHLTDNIMYHISLNANERLESLDLTRCTTITDAGFQYWTYRTFPNLKKLSLKDCTFLSDKAIISIANAAPNLEILDLNFCCALLDIAIEVLCLGCQKLRELDLSFCGSAVSDSSLVAISLHLRNLSKLVVKGCVRVTRAGVDALLSGYSPLNYINISQCRNAHMYPGRIPAQTLQVNPATKSAFITAGPAAKIIEIVI